MYVDEMSLNEMSEVKMSVDEMTCSPIKLINDSETIIDHLAKDKSKNKNIKFFLKKNERQTKIVFLGN